MRNLGGIITDHHLPCIIVPVASKRLRYVVNGGSIQWQCLVVPNAVFPATTAYSGEGCALSSCSYERAAVKRHTQDDFVSSHSARCVVGYCLVSTEWSARWAGFRSIDIGVVAGNCAPTTSIIIGHQIPGVDVSVRLAYVKFLIMRQSWSKVSFATNAAIRC